MHGIEGTKLAHLISGAHVWVGCLLYIIMAATAHGCEDALRVTDRGVFPTGALNSIFRTAFKTASGSIQHPTPGLPTWGERVGVKLPSLTTQYLSSGPTLRNLVGLAHTRVSLPHSWTSRSSTGQSMASNWQIRVQSLVNTSCPSAKHKKA